VEHIEQHATRLQSGSAISLGVVTSGDCLRGEGLVWL